MEGDLIDEPDASEVTLLKDIYMLIDNDNDKTLYPYEFRILWDAIKV